MNFFAFINNKGVVKTAAGHNIEDITLHEKEKYCIKGNIVWGTGYRMPMIWESNGSPNNLPLNHGLNLIPVVPILDFKYIKEMSHSEQ